MGIQGVNRGQGSLYKQIDKKIIGYGQNGRIPHPAKERYFYTK